MRRGKDTNGRGEAFEQVRVGVVMRLRMRRSEIDEAIFARVRDLAPGMVGLGDPEYVAGLRAAITAAVDFVLVGLEHGGESGSQTPSVVVAQARRAARVGVGLDTVLRRYVAGLAILEDFIMQEADHSDFVGQRTALRHVLEASASLLDRLIPSITSAYTQELEQAGNPPVRRDHASVPGRSKQSSYRMRSAADADGSAAAHEQVAQSQRARILQALVEVVAERGFAGTTVKLVRTRAGVSSRTFYECFEGLEDCFTAVLDLGQKRTIELVSLAFEREECWQDGVRSVLALLLAFLDSEPLLARVWLVESLAAGSWAHEHRERNLADLRELVLARWPASDSWTSPPLAAEGVMSSVLGIMHAHILQGKPELFIELLGPLMGLVTAPYLDARGVEREIERGDELAREILAGDTRWAPPSAQATGQDTGLGVGQGVALPATLNNPSAHRARECLLFLAEHPDSSNREVAMGIDVAHQSQISSLLAYLFQENLVTKRSEGRGKRNAWQLTPRGEEIARALSEQRGSYGGASVKRQR